MEKFVVYFMIYWAVSIITCHLYIFWKANNWLKMHRDSVKLLGGINVGQVINIDNSVSKPHTGVLELLMSDEKFLIYEVHDSLYSIHPWRIVDMLIVREIARKLAAGQKFSTGKVTGWRTLINVNARVQA